MEVSEVGDVGLGFVSDTLGMANGGLDLEMPKAVWYTSAKLKPLVESGKVSESTIDDKVRRLFRMAISMWVDGCGGAAAEG